MMGQVVAGSVSVPATLTPHVRAFETQICKISILTSRRRPAPFPSRAIAPQSIHARLVTERLWQGRDVGFTAIANTLARGSTVTIATFRAFTTRTLHAHERRNPYMGDRIAIAASVARSFIVSKTPCATSAFIRENVMNCDEMIAAIQRRATLTSFMTTRHPPLG